MLETYYRIMKHDPEGRLVRDTGLMPSHSYVIQFLELLGSLLSSSDKTATDVTGAESVLMDISDDMPTKGNAVNFTGSDTAGIVVGTNAGTTAEDNENYALDTKILHSATEEANKLNYQAVTRVVAHVDGANVDLHISRAFLNESGGTISVKEIGLICKNTTDSKYHLLLRDVVAQEDVLDDYTLTVVYTLRTTA